MILVVFRTVLLVQRPLDKPLEGALYKYQLLLLLLLKVTHLGWAIIYLVLH